MTLAPTAGSTFRPAEAEGGDSDGNSLDMTHVSDGMLLRRYLAWCGATRTAPVDIEAEICSGSIKTKQFPRPKHRQQRPRRKKKSDSFSGTVLNPAKKLLAETPLAGDNHDTTRITTSTSSSLVTLLSEDPAKPAVTKAAEKPVICGLPYPRGCPDPKPKLHPLPAAVFREEVLRFDCRKYNFAEIVASDILGVSGRSTVSTSSETNQTLISEAGGSSSCGAYERGSFVSTWRPPREEVVEEHADRTDTVSSAVSKDGKVTGSRKSPEGVENSDSISLSEKEARDTQKNNEPFEFRIDYSSTAAENKRAAWEACVVANHNRVRFCERLETMYTKFIHEVIGPHLIQEVYYGRDSHINAISAAEQVVSDGTGVAAAALPACEGPARTSITREIFEKIPQAKTRRVRVLYQYPPTMRAFCSETVQRRKPAAHTEDPSTQPGPVDTQEPVSAHNDDSGHTPEEKESEKPAASTTSFRSLGRMHNDAEYGHQPGEVNFWLPLSECNPENTMWLESAPGRGDWRPILLSPGPPGACGLQSALAESESGSEKSGSDCKKVEKVSQDGTHVEDGVDEQDEQQSTKLSKVSKHDEHMSDINDVNDGSTAELLRFHGTLCRHFARPNTSGKTRVSMDFRCCVEDSFDPEWRMSTSNHAHERRFVDYDVVFS